MFNFAQKELAPMADEIDRTNNFVKMRVSDRYFVDFESLKDGFCRNFGRNSVEWDS